MAKPTKASSPSSPVLTPAWLTQIAVNNGRPRAWQRSSSRSRCPLTPFDLVPGLRPLDTAGLGKVSVGDAHTSPCGSLELVHGFFKVQLLGELRAPCALFQKDRILREVTAAGGALVIGDHLVDLLVGLRAEVPWPTFDRFLRQISRMIKDAGSIQSRRSRGCGWRVRGNAPPCGAFPPAYLAGELSSLFASSGLCHQS